MLMGNLINTEQTIEITYKTKDFGKLYKCQSKGNNAKYVHCICILQSLNSSLECDRFFSRRPPRITSSIQHGLANFIPVRCYDVSLYLPIATTPNLQGGHSRFLV